MAAKQSSTKAQPEPKQRAEGGSPAFLLAQIGAHAAMKFAERLAPLGLTPAHVGSLRVIAGSSGSSQQEIAERLGMFPSRFVALVDELQNRSLVERVANPRDRRVYMLQLTADGQQILRSIGKVAREHQDALLAALDSEQREQLASLLSRVADQQGLRPGVHPGFARMRPGTSEAAGPGKHNRR